MNEQWEALNSEAWRIARVRMAYGLEIDAGHRAKCLGEYAIAPGGLALFARLMSLVVTQ